MKIDCPDCGWPMEGKSEEEVMEKAMKHMKTGHGKKMSKEEAKKRMKK